MTDPNRAPRWRTALTVSLGLVLVTAVLCRTNPTHFRHVGELYGPYAAAEWWDLKNAPTGNQSARSPLPRLLPDPPAPDTRYHDYYLVSTTTAADGSGGLLSLGLLHNVIDLRSKP